MNLRMYNEVVSGGWFGLGGALLLILIAILMFLASRKKAAIITSIAAILQLIGSLLTLTDNANRIVLGINSLALVAIACLWLINKTQWKRFGAGLGIFALTNGANLFQILYQLNHGDRMWEPGLAMFETFTSIVCVGVATHMLSSVKK